MRKVAALILSIHFLLSGFLPEQSIAELNKIPSLVQHYFHHTQEHHETISFTQFLAMHYGDTRHAEEENHDDLPLFNSICNCILFVHQDNKIIIQENPFLNHIYFSAYDNAYAFSKNASIFQPPRFS